MDHTQASGDVIKDPSAFTALTKIHKKPVLDCCFSPETDQIITASEDSTVVLWNLPPSEIELHDETINDDHKLVCYRLSDHKTAVTSVAMHKKFFLSASKDGLVKLWRLVSDSSGDGPSFSINRQKFKQPSPDPLTYNCHQRAIESICFAPNGHYFATGSANVVKISSAECRNKHLVTLPDGHKSKVKSVRWAKTNDSLLASCGDDGRICIWDARTKVRQPPCVMVSLRNRHNCLDWHPVFEHHIATGSAESKCIIWDLRNKKQVQVYMEHNDSVNSIAFNSGGSLLLSGSSDKTSRIFDVCEGRNMFTLISHNAAVTSVCFNATGDLFATGSEDKTVTVWKRNFETVNIVLDDGNEEPTSVADYY